MYHVGFLLALARGRGDRSTLSILYIFICRAQGSAEAGKNMICLWDPSLIKNGFEASNANKQQKSDTKSIIC